MPPALITLLGVLRDVTGGHLLKRPPATQGQPIGMGVSALGDLVHDLAGQLARVGERNRSGVAQVIPARSVVNGGLILALQMLKKCVYNHYKPRRYMDY